MNKKREYNMSIIVAILLLLLGSFYYFSEIANNYIALLFVVLGIAIAVVQTLRLNKFGAGVEQDERTRKVSTRSISYSWVLSFVFLNLLIWLDILDIINLNLLQGLSIMSFVMIISAAAFKLSLNNKKL